MKIRTDSEIKIKPTKKTIQVSQSWEFEKFNEIDKLLVKWISKRRQETQITNNKKNTIT